MDYKATFDDGSELYFLQHHGIKGMKWGIRNYQNEDGTLTEEGRRRYGVKERNADTRFRKSDVYAMEGAKRGGLLGAAIGKVVGVHKERQERKQDRDGLTKEERKIFDDAAALEKKALYDSSVNSRSKPLAQRVNDTLDHLQKICDAHINRLSEVMKAIPGANPYDDADSLYDGSFASSLAYRINERFDVDRILDQRMDEYVHDYREGLISKKEFRQHYDAELNDYSAWVVDTFNTEELKKVAKTFADTKGYAPGEYDDTSPKTGWKDYLRRVDSFEGVDSISMNRQNSKKSKSWVEEAANDPKHWRQVEDGSGERLYKRVEPTKSSGRYKTGSSKETQKRHFDRVKKENNVADRFRSELEQIERSLNIGDHASVANASNRITDRIIGSEKAMINRAKSLKNSGKTIEEVAKALGIPRSTAADYIYW